MYDNQHTSDEWLRAQIESLNEVPPPVLWDQQGPWESLEATLEASNSQKPAWLWPAIGVAACFCLLMGWLGTRSEASLIPNDTQLTTLEETIPAIYPQQAEEDCLETFTDAPVASLFPSQDSPIRTHTASSVSPDPVPQQSLSTDTLSPEIDLAPAELDPQYAEVLPDSNSQQAPVDQVAVSESVVKPSGRAPVMQFTESTHSHTLVNLNPSNRKKIKIRLGNSRRQERRVNLAPAVAGMTTRLKP